MQSTTDNRITAIMITNLILDIGNVICDWNPDGLVARTFSDPADQQEALRVTVRTPDWLALDRGTLALEDAVSRAQARTQLAPDELIDRLVDQIVAERA